MPFFVFVLSLNHPHICSVDINHNRNQPLFKENNWLKRKI